MIVTEIFFGVKCNRCGDVCSDGEHEYWSDEDNALENAINSDWLGYKKKHYCGNCYDWITNEPFPHFTGEILEVKKIIEKMLPGYDFKTRDDAEKTIFLKKMQQPISKIYRNLIAEIAGEKLINMDCISPTKHFINYELRIELSNPKKNDN